MHEKPTGAQKVDVLQYVVAPAPWAYITVYHKPTGPQVVATRATVTSSVSSPGHPKKKVCFRSSGCPFLKPVGRPHLIFFPLNFIFR